MAPFRVLGSLATAHSFGISTRTLQPRAFTSKSLTTAIVILAIFSAILFASILFVLVKFWKQVAAKRLASRSTAEVSKDVGATIQRKPSDWARKDSNILWSMYIEEDDLKSQFSMPPKSRLFSIGSVSTDHGRCPLDRRDSNADALSKNRDAMADEAEAEKEGEKPVNSDTLRSRAVYEQETTPTKTVPRTRSRSQPFHHRQSDSLEHIAKRKQSVPEQYAMQEGQC
ncbi:hypothetical protein HRR83_004371 [Exophiala dermatitidis]|uniref:Uncharacterized protein n=1 Tax=Exophiala dermatitidis TaxID=5970 RepID=A0AAN6ETJ0_EXODE|nr:hypothetical protein HRR73_006166 [Exophiala dermatitidis]KAJ4517670.1 hypothetical protein HRR75_002888 [Exophiala dermatitidis]KAJ4521324.1 hypothetical protein HRR74_003147 [Exophiala dermatitidis]KAJ4541991.1 hypothetical protein HRR77_005882 [Exophiala dermatitidis]KAJ4551942.1 hypothetical protein HRR78_003508 [Exophiala dermatitidis]